jgi:hypothetical protein
MSDVDQVTVRFALRAAEDARLDLLTGKMTREQIRMIGVLGSTYGIFRKEHPTEPYSSYVERVIEALKKEVKDD